MLDDSPCVLPHEQSTHHDGIHPHTVPRPAARRHRGEPRRPAGQQPGGGETLTTLWGSLTRWSTHGRQRPCLPTHAPYLSSLLSVSCPCSSILFYLLSAPATCCLLRSLRMQCVTRNSNAAHQLMRMSWCAEFELRGAQKDGSRPPSATPSSTKAPASHLRVEAALARRPDPPPAASACPASETVLRLAPGDPRPPLAGQNIGQVGHMWA